MSPVIHTEDFLRVLKESRLLEAAALESYLEQLRSETFSTRNGTKLAMRMVHDGVLTPFQAKRLLGSKPNGFLLDGKYKLLELLGVGRKGHVFLCDHLFLRQLVAVRILALGEDPPIAVVDQYRRLIRTSASLDHRHLVRSYEVSSAGRLQFMVMEYVDGRNLQDLVQRHGPMTVARAAHYVSQATTGLQQAAQAGLLHGEMTPANLLLDRHGTIKLRDLGLARSFPSFGSLAGTAEDDGSVPARDFRAPEQETQAADGRTDIYGLGAIFYFLLTGQGPPKGTASLPEDVPDRLGRIIHKMLARDPAGRFATPAKVLDALAPFTREPVPPPTTEEIPLPCAAITRSLAAMHKAGSHSGAAQQSDSAVPERNGRRPFGVGLLMALGVSGSYLMQGMNAAATAHGEESGHVS